MNGVQLEGLHCRPFSGLPSVLLYYIANPFFWIKNGAYGVTNEQMVSLMFYSANDGIMSAARTIDSINDDLQEITDNFNIAFLIADFFASY